jgi:hypothetical protein
MTEYKPLELCPALQWAAAQSTCNPVVVENNHTYGELEAAMPDELKTEANFDLDQINLFAAIFSNPFMRWVMCFFWMTYRWRKALDSFPTAAAWD